MTFRYPENIQSRLEQIYGVADEQQRRTYIQDLAAINSRDASRALQELYRHSVWRQNKIDILSQMGGYTDPRSLEFLLRIAADPEDLSLAQTAIQALTQGKSFWAVRFLMSLMKDREHPLFKDACRGIAYVRDLDSVDFLTKCLDQAQNLAPAAQEAVLSALLAQAPMEPRSAQPLAQALSLASPYWVSEGARQMAQQLQGLLGVTINAATTVEYLPENDYGTLSAQIQSLLLSHFSFEEVLRAWQQSSSGSHQRYLWGRMLRGFSQQIAPLIQDFDHLKQSDLWWQACWLAAPYMGGDNFGSVTNQYLELSIGQQRLLRPWAFIVERWAQGRGTQECLDFVESMPRSSALEWLPACLHKEEATVFLSNIISGESEQISDRIEALNQWAFFAMQADQGRWSEQSIQSFLGMLSNSKLPQQVRNRIWRVLGQLPALNQAAYDAMKQSLGQQDKRDEWPSIYYALGFLNNRRASGILVDQLQRLLKSVPDDADSMAMCLKAMSEHDRLDDAAVFEGISGKQVKLHFDSLLMIASRQRLKQSPALILQGLSSADFQHQLLALAAAAFDDDPKVGEALMAYLEGQSGPLLIRAVYALAVRAQEREQLAVLQKLAQSAWSEDLCEHLLNCFEPNTSEDYRAVISQLLTLIKEDERFAHPLLSIAAQNLVDNLTILSSERELVRTLSTTAKNNDEEHQGDRDLPLEILESMSFSETIRSVLRNAELTFHRQDLFDHRVDKSTIIVEYVKSIDLFLQERMGPMLFLGRQHALLSKLQSRLLMLKLDDENISLKQRLEELQCTDSFSEETFPIYKTMNLTRALISGRILKDQYRVIDGLRAWAIILLLFCRRFNYAKLVLEPVIPMKNADSEKINALAATLNALQERRNQAAHRGTVSSMDELLKIRQDSLGCLVGLDQILKAK